MGKFVSIEESIGPWIKMADFGAVKRTENVIGWEMNTLLAKWILFYFSSKATWLSFKMKVFKRLARDKIIWKKIKIVKFKSENCQLLIPLEKTFCPMTDFRFSAAQ